MAAPRGPRARLHRATDHTPRTRSARGHDGRHTQGRGCATSHVAALYGVVAVPRMVRRACLTCSALFDAPSNTAAGFCSEPCRLERKHSTNAAAWQRRKEATKARKAELAQTAQYVEVVREIEPPPPPSVLPCETCRHWTMEDRAELGGYCTIGRFLAGKPHTGRCPWKTEIINDDHTR